MVGKLFICATPIGNLGDITLRVVETLGQVDIVVAEDTRRTRKLLTHLDIKKKVISFHDHNEAQILPKLMSELRLGRKIAQVSDAGMPGIADPGHRLIKACIEDGIPFEVLPGPCAFLNGAVLSGLPTDDIRFLGYFPRKSGARKRLLKEVEESPSTLVFYESPRRLKQTLVDIGDVLNDRQVFVGRELTKKFEEHLRGPAKQLLENLGDRTIKGELVVVIAGLREKNDSFEHEQIVAEIEKEMENGQSKSEAVKIVADRYSLPRRLVYEAAHAPE